MCDHSEFSELTCTNGDGPGWAAGAEWIHKREKVTMNLLSLLGMGGESKKMLQK